MKKLFLCTIALLLIVGAAGCKKEEAFISIDNITADTILAKSNGVLQVATVEDFEKSYYDLNELKSFIENKIDGYNQKAGAGKITVDAVEIHNGNAIMLLTYSGMDQYAAFNEASAAYFNGGVTDVPLNLPTTLVTAKNGTLASTQEVLGDSKLKILVMNEPYDIMVDGTVRYYSENAAYVDSHTVRGAQEGMTVVVYKP
ncbi:hypothetical protein HNQ56_001378 [Anaerotaenia torta]|uniref:hypothetical protein n=1 Tax=Anaerotaenia torta TaxID=433293 RepID=UPI003D19C856